MTFWLLQNRPSYNQPNVCSSTYKHWNIRQSLNFNLSFTNLHLFFLTNAFFLNATNCSSTAKRISWKLCQLKQPTNAEILVCSSLSNSTIFLSVTNPSLTVSAYNFLILFSVQFLFWKIRIERKGEFSKSYHEYLILQDPYFIVPILLSSLDLLT